MSRDGMNNDDYRELTHLTHERPSHVRMMTLPALPPAPPETTSEAEAYPANWRHATIHLNPETGEMHSDGDHSVREWIQSRLAASPAPSGAPNQARDDIGVDDGATDGHAVSVNRSAPRLAEVEKAMTAYRLACIARGAIGGTDTILAEMESTHAALLALYRPAGETRAGAGHD